MPMSIDAKAMMNNELDGSLKIVADKNSRRIVGVDFFADYAEMLAADDGDPSPRTCLGHSNQEVALALGFEPAPKMRKMRPGILLRMAC